MLLKPKNIFKTIMPIILLTVTFVFAQERGTFTDSRDGKIYRYVTIGTQTWMAQNLNYQTGNSWCYDNDESNCNIYGRLYDWNTAMTACPAGWHLPTHDEWTVLENAVGGEETAGTELKSKDGWSENGNGSDDFGFSALPGGGRWDGSFSNVGYNGNWWSATEYNAGYARCRVMGYSYEHVFSNWFNNSNGFSVRCVRD